MKLVLLLALVAIALGAPIDHRRLPNDAAFNSDSSFVAGEEMDLATPGEQNLVVDQEVSVVAEQNKDSSLPNDNAFNSDSSYVAVEQDKVDSLPEDGSFVPVEDTDNLITSNTVVAESNTIVNEQSSDNVADDQPIMLADPSEPDSSSLIAGSNLGMEAIASPVVIADTTSSDTISNSYIADEPAGRVYTAEDFGMQVLTPSTTPSDIVDDDTSNNIADQQESNKLADEQASANLLAAVESSDLIMEPYVASSNIASDEQNQVVVEDENKIEANSGQNLNVQSDLVAENSVNDVAQDTNSNTFIAQQSQTLVMDEDAANLLAAIQSSDLVMQPYIASPEQDDVSSDSIVAESSSSTDVVVQESSNDNTVDLLAALESSQNNQADSDQPITFTW